MPLGVAIARACVVHGSVLSNLLRACAFSSPEKAGQVSLPGGSYANFVTVLRFDVVEADALGSRAM